MTDTPWTPGSWSVIEHIEKEPGKVSAWSEVFAFAPNGIGGRHIAHVPDDADARLISVAPEMAQLLKRVHEWFTDEGLDCITLDSEATALLARIRGEV